ncbi:hypothetical protein [Streptomyces sp. NPDC058683]|uniref:hypothetical protein n=1 Tax=Streptomyces sp. NPDC058683 TaxID=3346597 RepID=UPI0036597F3E
MKPVRRIRAGVADRIAGAAGTGRVPGLATMPVGLAAAVPVGLAAVSVGDDPVGAVHVAVKRRAADEADPRDFHRRLPGHTAQDKVAAVIDAPAPDPDVSGIRPCRNCRNCRCRTP